MAAPKPTTSRTPSIIAEGVIIEGNVSEAGELQLDGHIEGNLNCENLVMGESGNLNGLIIANDVVIRGTVRGEIRAKIVRLEKTAIVEGDVFHESLSIESGAKISGRFAHLSSELASKSANVATPAKSANGTADTPAYIADQPAAE